MRKQREITPDRDHRELLPIITGEPRNGAENYSQPRIGTNSFVYSLFFIVKDLDKVTLVIREQFIFRRFIMLNMFLGAAGFSAFV